MQIVNFLKLSSVIYFVPFLLHFLSQFRLLLYLIAFIVRHLDLTTCSYWSPQCLVSDFFRPVKEGSTLGYFCPRWFVSIFKLEQVKRLCHENSIPFQAGDRQNSRPIMGESEVRVGFNRYLFATLDEPEILNVSMREDPEPEQWPCHQTEVSFSKPLFTEEYLRVCDKVVGRSSKEQSEKGDIHLVVFQGSLVVQN